MKPLPQGLSKAELDEKTGEICAEFGVIFRVFNNTTAEAGSERTSGLYSTPCLVVDTDSSYLTMHQTISMWMLSYERAFPNNEHPRVRALMENLLSELEIAGRYTSVAVAPDKWSVCTVSLASRFLEATQASDGEIRKELEGRRSMVIYWSGGYNFALGSDGTLEFRRFIDAVAPGATEWVTLEAARMFVPYKYRAGAFASTENQVRFPSLKAVRSECFSLNIPSVKAFYVTVKDETAMVDLLSCVHGATFVNDDSGGIVPIHCSAFVSEVACLCFDPAAYMATGIIPFDRRDAAGADSTPVLAQEPTSLGALGEQWKEPMWDTQGMLA